MKSRKQRFILVLCLLSALSIALAFTARSGAIKGIGQHDRTALVQPAAYISNPSLGAAVAAEAMFLDRPGDQRLTATMQSNGGHTLPTAEEFTLTPPNPAENISKTTLSVRFPESEAKKLPSLLPMTLGDQHVVLQRSAEVPELFSTLVDFNWTLFIKQQQHRKELANEGKTVPIYKGRDFVRRERVQFIDPAGIQKALQSHQPVRFSPLILLGGDLVTIVPDHQLMMIDTHVVEDGSIEQLAGLSGRTYDACISNDRGNPNGAWTFQTLWMAAFNTTSVAAAEQQLANFLANWQSNQSINNFTVDSRPLMGTLGSTGLLQNWPLDTNGNMCTFGPNGPQVTCPSLLAPVRLNAIVNRVDLGGQEGQTPAGELRFVFGVAAGTQALQGCLLSPNTPPLFNIIFEYKVPSSWSAPSWAAQWGQLPTDNWSYNNSDCPSDGCYMSLLQSLITDNVVKENCQVIGGSMNTCLSHIRTNEIALDNGADSIWEQRQFTITSYGPNTLTETVMFQTPDNSFNFGGAPCGGPGLPGCTSQPSTFADYINEYENSIVSNLGTYPFVTNQYPSGQSFQAGSSFNGFNTVNAGTYWNECTSEPCTQISGSNGLEARRYFSLNTCNGCHGAETNTLGFQQVFNRLPGNPSNLSNFLLGCVTSAGGSCVTSGDPGSDGCTVGHQGTTSGDQCQLDFPGQELVPDPANPGSNGSHAYGDIALRLTILQTDLSPSNYLFLPLIRPKIGSGH